MTALAEARLDPAVKPSRWIHVPGAAFGATFRGETTAPWLAEVAPFDGTKSYEAVVRASRFLPGPDNVAEVLCLAVKIIDGCGTDCDQDLTFFSSPHWRLLHAWIAFRRHAGGVVFSTAMPYRVEGPGATRVVFGATLSNVEIHPAATAFAELARAMGEPGFSLNLLTATKHGRWQRAGELTDFSVLGPSGQSIRFRPGHTSPKLRLTKFGQWRDRLYGCLQQRTFLDRFAQRPVGVD